MQRMRAGRRLVLALTLTLTACATTPAPTSVSGPAGIDPPARFGRPSVPYRFAVGRGDSLHGDYDVTLDGHTMLVSSRLGDAPLSGATFPSSVPPWQAAPVHPFARAATAADEYPDAAYPRPLVTTLEGRRTVLFGSLVATGGGHRAVEVDAADPGSGALLWHTELPVADDAGDSGWYAVAVLDAGAAGLVVGLAGEPAQSWLLDPATRAVRWHTPGVGVLAVEGFAVGTAGGRHDPHRVVALRLADGTPAWAQDAAGDRLWSAGPGLVAVRTTGPPEGLRLLDAVTGADVPGVVPAGGTGPCRSDGRSVTVCGLAWTPGGGPVFAFDPAARRRLWSQPGLAVSAVFHGAAYGLGPGGPAVFDAATGQVREAAPDLPYQPYAVNEYLAVLPGAPADDAPFVAYFATG